MSNRNLFATLLLLVFAVISWFLVHTQQEEAAVFTPQEHRPDAWARDLDVTEMDDLGKPRYNLKADKMVHFDDDESTVLTEPRLTVFNHDRPPWHVDSTVGWVSADRTLVLLTGEVIINREGKGRLRPLRAVTSELRVKPQENYAETDRHVRIDSRDDWLESDGAEIWFEEPVRMKFLSRVKASYEIN